MFSVVENPSRNVKLSIPMKNRNLPASFFTPPRQPNNGMLNSPIHSRNGSTVSEHGDAEFSPAPRYARNNPIIFQRKETAGILKMQNHTSMTKRPNISFRIWLTVSEGLNVLKTVERDQSVNKHCCWDLWGMTLNPPNVDLFDRSGFSWGYST